MRALFFVAVSLLCSAGCGPLSKDLSLNVTWSFLSGDFASNAVQTVRVTWGPTGGEKQTVDFNCAAGQGKLGELSPAGGSYGITAEGLDSGGIARVTHFGSTITVGSSGTFGQPVELTLRPKPADVIVN